MVLDENSLPHLLKNDLIGKLSALLCDDNINIVQSAAGTLRNISITAGHDACQRMVSKDQILGSLSSSLNLVKRVYLSLLHIRMIEYHEQMQCVIDYWIKVDFTVLNIL